MNPYPDFTAIDGLMSSSQDIGLGVVPLKIEGDRILLVDQRALPDEFIYFDATNLENMCFAIDAMVVRGAPAIGIAAAFGLASEARRLASQGLTAVGIVEGLLVAKGELDKTRPTAVNLFWATNKVYSAARGLLVSEPMIGSDKLVMHLELLSKTLLNETITANRDLSNFGKNLLEMGSNVLTHCNAGSLATGGWGTALGVIRSAYFAGLKPHVYVDETRPRLQGSKLTIWELTQDGIPCTLICDALAGYLMSLKKIDLVIVGADRIALNGDTANKVGTYSLAVLAQAHSIPFYVAAPLSTVDGASMTGYSIQIETRSDQEIIKIGDVRLAPGDVTALNLAFDVTPAHLITAIITESGVLYPNYEESIAQALRSTESAA